MYTCSIVLTVSISCSCVVLCWFSVKFVSQFYLFFRRESGNE